MACAGAPESLANMLEIEDDCPLDYAMVCKTCYAMKVKVEKEADIARSAPRSVKIEHLHMSFPQGNQLKQTLTHLIDVIKNHKGDFNFDDVAALLKQRSFSDLPSVLKPEKAIAHGYVMNMNIIQTSDGVFDIIKHYMFDSQVPHAVAFQIAQGHRRFLRHRNV